jgi:hypothetical protein
MIHEEGVATGTRRRFILESKARLVIGLTRGVENLAEKLREYELKLQ